MDTMTVIEPVLEVTLAGTAAAQPWRSVLAAAGLVLPDGQESVAVLISAIDSTYYGVRFQELSVSVQVAEQAWFLTQAYNGNALFAWVERRMFRTPYDHARISVSPHSLTLEQGGTRLLAAALDAQSAPTGQAHEQHDLTIHLPRSRSGTRYHFHARLEGQTDIYPAGTVQITPAVPVWALLCDSGFLAQSWRVRPAARHSKGKTVVSEGG